MTCTDPERRDPIAYRYSRKWIKADTNFLNRTQGAASGGEFLEFMKCKTPDMGTKYPYRRGLAAAEEHDSVVEAGKVWDGDY